METPEKLNANPLVREALSRIPVSQEALLIGKRVLTPKQVDFLNVRYRTYGDEYLQLELDDLRAWDSEAKEIRTDRDVAELTIYEHMLKTLIDSQKIRELGPEGASYIAGELAVIREKLLLTQEYRILTLLTTAANYAADHKDAGAVVDFAATGIQAKVLAAADAIATSTGLPPNKFVVALDSYRLLLSNPDILAKYNPKSILINEAVLADYFEVDEVIVSRSRYKALASSAATPIMTNVSFLCRSEVSPAAPINSATTIGRLAWRPYGGVEFDTRQTPPMGVEELIEAGIATTYAPIVTNWDAGYLFTDNNG